MNKDQVTGSIITVASILGILVYGWLLFFIAPQIVLQISAFVAVAAVLGILTWIGYTLATTPTPAPINMEKEQESAAKEELKTESGVEGTAVSSSSDQKAVSIFLKSPLL